MNFHLPMIERLARIADQIDPDDLPDIVPPRWGPASWFRLGIAALGVLIAVLLIVRFLG